MDVDKEVQAEVDRNDGVKKAKRKPAKKAKRLVKKTKAAKKKKVAKANRPAKKAKAKKPAKKAAGRTVERFERIDMRLSKPEKARVVAKAKKLRRTITSVVLEAVQKIR